MASDSTASAPNSTSVANSALVAEAVERRLVEAGIELTFGGEPTYVPFDPEGAEWSVAADGPSKLGYAKALGRKLQERQWPGSTLIYCPGKRYDGEVNPRWALRLITGADGTPVVNWPQQGLEPAAQAALPHPTKKAARQFLAAIGAALGCKLHPLELRDPLSASNRVWAAPLCHEDVDSHDEGSWHGAQWPLKRKLRELSGAPGPAGLRLPLQHFPQGVLCQVLTLEISADGWNLFLPPLARQPLEQLLLVIAEASRGWSQPELSGVLPLDIDGTWQVLGLTADPGVLEVNLPVCRSWEAYAGWIRVLEEAGEAVGLRSWRRRGDQIEGSGGGNHLLWGGPSLETNPFFPRPAWLVGILRYWQHHPSLAYLFSGNSVGPASQAPRPDEGSADWLDLQLAHSILEALPEGDQRVAISETLRHLHADKSGNTHRSEISLDKFWNPAWAAGCQGLIEFRALETFPHHQWTGAVALLWRALALHLLRPSQRPSSLKPWGASLHDQWLLPSQLWLDLEAVLEELTADGLPLDASIFRTIWNWRFPVLLQWQEQQASLEIRRALEPWPLLCDTPVEGGSTSRFVDSSLRRFEVIGNGAFHQRYGLVLNGRPLRPGTDGRQPLAVRYRQESLYPCLHPCIANHVPLELVLVDSQEIDPAKTGPRKPLASWVLEQEASGFKPTAVDGQEADLQLPNPEQTPWQGSWPGACTVDLRLN
ncbi:transglutaminase family protein [Cyanobium sp. WAJ14-Wanaka]|uniref:transglutaminase family protein n=1 Tax=Cyanobium sp. WAJ14-Wanaka TaxID=2823725 RepID=UPI0020CF6963|nr:transglutaminase family protein [Cyanobium sp. WAJ14-Wanaka]MCP9775495.1 transglutaminase family protein [Cyanobium sp. WAJ14-Wanaka]